MPNIKSAKKNVLINEKRRKANSSFKSSMKSAIKQVEKLVKSNEKENINIKLNEANKKIDKAVKRGLIHKNKAARNKAKLNKMINNME